MDSFMEAQTRRAGELITSRIFIEASVETESGEAVVTIRDSHTNIVRIAVNGEVVFSGEEKRGDETQAKPLIHAYTLEQIYEYSSTVDVEEIRFIMDAFQMNYELFEEGLENPRTTYARYLLKKNGGEIFSEDEQKTASLLCNAAIEARVINYRSGNIPG